MNQNLTFSSLIYDLQSNLSAHVPGSKDNMFMEDQINFVKTKCLEFSEINKKEFTFDLNKNLSIVWPLINMGSVSSIDLLRVDELIMFAYYLKNKNNYDLAFDLGANIGLHSLVLAKIDYPVVAFEPDPVHFKLLQENIRLNQSKNITCLNIAVANKKGTAEFLRVKGNTTSSHIKGFKSNPYGELDQIKIHCDRLDNYLDPDKKTLMKIDIEGMEAEIICGLNHRYWQNLDAFVEIGTEENAEQIYEYCYRNKINIFVQKEKWGLCKSSNQMPKNYKYGSIFISSKNLSW